MSTSPDTPPPAEPDTAAEPIAPAAQDSAPAKHWRRRARSTPMPSGHAARQGDITTLAFQLLGRERAIAFLNTDNPALGGRPLALATEGDEGQALIVAEIHRLADDADDGAA